MINLTKFKNNQLDKNLLKEIKGGLRFETSHRPTFRAKKRELRRQGIAFTVLSNNNNHFCLEW